MALAERRDAALEAAGERLQGAARIDRAEAVRARDEAGKQLASLRAENKRLGDEASARLATLVERDRQLAALTKRCDESAAECRRLREALTKEEALRRGAEEEHHAVWSRCEQLREQHEVAEKKVLAMRDAFLRRTAEISVWKSYAPPITDAVIQQQVDKYLAQHKASR